MGAIEDAGYSYPSVLILNYQQIDALPIPDFEKNNIKLRKYANSLDNDRREALIKVMSETFVSPDITPKAKRDTVVRWLRPDPPQKNRTNFFGRYATKDTAPKSYDPSYTDNQGKYRSKQPETPKAGDKVKMRNKFLEGLTNAPPTGRSTNERKFTSGKGKDKKVEKDKIIQYLQEDPIWDGGLQPAFYFDEDFDLVLEYFNDSPGQGASGLRASYFDGLI